MPSTALEIVTSYLQEALEGSEEEGLDGVTILWGPPVGDNTPAKVVCVGFGPDGQSGESNREFKLLGGAKVDESISVDLMAQVIQVANAENLKAAYQASYTIARAVENTIRADITLGNSLLEPAILSKWRGSYFRSDEARGHRVFLTLTGVARI